MGLATVGISLVRGQTERLHPPRALYCEFPLGRPLGRPLDPVFQRRVLDAVFALLSRPTGPVLEDFPERIEDEVDQPLACALPPRFDPTLAPAVDEVLGLRRAYDRHLAMSGLTSMGRAIDADGVPDAVKAFIRIADGTPYTEVELSGPLVAVAADIRAYYEETALALADHVPAARSSEAWYLSTTETGGVMRRAQAALRAAGAPPEIAGYMTPRWSHLPKGPSTDKTS